MTTIVYLKCRVLVRDNLTVQTHDDYCIPQRSCFSTIQTNCPHTTTIVHHKGRVLVRDKLTVHTRRLLYTSKVVV